jgi:hypothetical protein
LTWADEDRGLALAHLAEARETCPSCGNQMSQCRDPGTQQRWEVVRSVCEASRVAQAYAENDAEAGRNRGTHYHTRLRVPGGG